MEERRSVRRVSRRSTPSHPGTQGPRIITLRRPGNSACCHLRARTMARHRTRDRVDLTGLRIPCCGPSFPTYPTARLMFATPQSRRIRAVRHPEWALAYISTQRDLGREGSRAQPGSRASPAARYECGMSRRPTAGAADVERSEPGSSSSGPDSPARRLGEEPSEPIAHYLQKYAGDHAAEEGALRRGGRSSGNRRKNVSRPLRSLIHVRQHLLGVRDATKSEEWPASRNASRSLVSARR